MTYRIEYLTIIEVEAISEEDAINKLLDRKLLTIERLVSCKLIKK